MLIEEACDFGEGFLGLRRGRIEGLLRVRHALERFQLGPSTLASSR
jgi:hypothetical protein